MKISKTIQKVSIVILCFLWIAVIVVGGTVAYLFTSTQQVINTFSVPSDGSSVVEEIENNVKKEVVIANTGDVDSYIRAKVIFTWQNADGDVYPTKVETTDYQITWGTGWVRIPDSETGFYYYNGVVKANDNDVSTTIDQTAALFTECTPTAAGPEEGYTLHVEILSQSIQAEPDEAVQEAWGMSYSNDAWSTYTAGTN